MTANPFAALLDGVARFSHCGDYAKLDPQGEWVVLRNVLAALAAAVPDDLAEAGNVLEGVTGNAWRIHRIASLNVETTDGRSIASCAGYSDNRRMAEVNEENAANARFIAWCREGVPALLARIAAQEAQIKGLETERRYWSGEMDTVLAGRADEHDRAEAAETALAAMTKERDELRELEKAAKGLSEVLDQHETKGPLPDVALMFCWLAAQNVRAALRGNTLEKPE